MKIIKLIGIFIIVAGVIVGILFLSGIGGGNKPLPQMDSEILADYKQDFKKNWDDIQDWDYKTFKRHCDDIRTLKSKYDVSELDDYNLNEALEIVNKKIFDLWSSSGCKKSEVDKYITAVDTIVRYDSRMAENTGIKKIRRVNSSYETARSLALKSFVLSPKFNGSTWQNFNTYADEQKAMKQNILDNSDYKEYLSNISEIKNGLNSLDSKLGTARSNFYSNLEGLIYDYFNKIKSEYRTRSQLDNLKKVTTRFNSENSSNSTKLAMLISTLSSDVQENEQKANETR